jgi:hypothetical protein
MFWQLIQLSEINTFWLWIRMHWCMPWVLIWFDVIHCCTNRTFTLSRARMTIVWEEVSVQSKLLLINKENRINKCLQRQEQQHKHCTKWGLYKLSAQRHILIQHLHDDCCCCCCCCWACHMRVSADIFNQERFHIQKMWVKKLKKKERSCMWGERFITHFTDR